MSRPWKPTALAACLAAALAACDGESAPPPREHTLAPPPEPPAPATSAASEPSSESPASAQDAGADGGVRLADLAGSWEGSYDAKKGRIDMPAGVSDPSRKADDGTTRAGPGSVKITVKPDGSVEGRSQGALGDASIHGKIDSKMLRTSFLPDDLSAPQAMSGVLTGIVKGDTIMAELRVAGPDAVLVRRADFEIKKTK